MGSTRREIPPAWEPYPPGTPVEVLVGRHLGYGDTVPGPGPAMWVRAVVTKWRGAGRLPNGPGGVGFVSWRVGGVSVKIVGGTTVEVREARYVRRREAA